MRQPLYAIDDVSLIQLEDQPSSLLVQVQARAVSSGWRAATLTRRAYRTPPADGVLALDLNGVAPKAPAKALPVLTRVSADMALTDLDVANYWGKEQPLVGVRCHGETNHKLARLAPKLGVPGLTVVPQTTTSQGVTPQFARDIRPLFRPHDIAMMIKVRDLDLGSYETVCQYGDLILTRLKDGSMPDDGPWPARDVALFEQWLIQGKAP